MITITEELLGFVAVDLRPYFAQSELSVSQRKYAVFEYNQESVFKNSELYWPLPDEPAIIESSIAKIEDVRQKKYFPKKEPEASEPIAGKGKTAPGKNVKKPPV